MQTLFLVLYFSLLSVLGILVLYRVKLLVIYLFTRKREPQAKEKFKTLPKVTIQLPIFNEENVAKRLIDSAIQVDYPKELLEIQVLDDSTDNTKKITKEIVDKYKQDGYSIVQICRTNRANYKAGALSAGLEVARGEFVAVFDADFVIPRDFLQKTIHHFTAKNIGMVQCRWGFLNVADSLLTRLQRTYLNGHFIIEHTSRNRSGNFFNFNGTAGIWRKEVIPSSGGWQGDTLTEDLDLSYRAQLKGWKFIYLKDLVAKSELPPTLDAFNGQQFRWVKGMVQVLLKLFGTILKSDIKLYTKIDAAFHLFSGLGYFLTVLVSFLSIPVLYFYKDYIDANMILLPMVLLCINLFFLWLYYAVADIEADKFRLKYLFSPFLLLVFSIGFSINGVYAILEALRGKHSPFIRTPKFSDGKLNIKSDNSSKLVYRVINMAVLYFLVMAYLVIISNKFVLIPAFLFFSSGYFWIFFTRLKERRVLKTIVN